MNQTKERVSHKKLGSHRLKIKLAELKLMVKGVINKEENSDWSCKYNIVLILKYIISHQKQY